MSTHVGHMLSLARRRLAAHLATEAASLRTWGDTAAAVAGWLERLAERLDPVPSVLRARRERGAV